MNISAIKEEQQKKVDDLLKEKNVFFAFSQSQFDEGKTPLAEGEHYVKIGGGGYMPKNGANAFFEEMQNIEIWFNDRMKDPELRRDNIKYELSNHEAYYTCEIEATAEALGDDYTNEEIRKVFREEQAKTEWSSYL